MLAIDYYKPDKRVIPTGGGVLILLSLVVFYGLNGVLALKGIELYNLVK